MSVDFKRWHFYFDFPSFIQDPNASITAISCWIKTPLLVNSQARNSYVNFPLVDKLIAITIKLDSGAMINTMLVISSNVKGLASF